LLPKACDIVKLFLFVHTHVSTRVLFLFCFINSIILLIFYVLYNVLRGICQERNKFSLLFFLSVARARLSENTREGELQASTRTPLSYPRFSSPKGVLDWLSNVDTTTAELRNHVRHSTWSLIELSEISLALLRQLVPDVLLLPNESVGQLSSTCVTDRMFLSLNE